MGYYIQTPENLNKAKQLQELFDAERIFCPTSFDEVPADKALICVVQNGLFDAAGYCYSAQEFEVFKHPDGRPRTWLLMDKEVVHQLTGFKG